MKYLIKRPFVRLSKHLNLWHEALHHRGLLDMARQRMLVASGLMSLAFLLICVRLVDVMVFRDKKTFDEAPITHENTLPRADIVDRNGEILATHLVTASLYANPKVIINAKEAAQKLAKVLPNVTVETLFQRLTSNKGFVWLSRHVPPKLQDQINHLGIPGVYLQKDHKRVYPYGALASHVLGMCGVDSNGLSGTEKFFDVKLRKNKEPLKISLDIRVQHIVHDELTNAMAEFNAIGGHAMVMDAKTGEMLAMVSLPGIDPNMPNQDTANNKAASKDTYNRNTLGVYEPGSTFKILNIAIALEAGSATTNSRYDARHAVQIGRFKVNDFKGKGRELSLTEAFVYSSNIAAIKIAQEFGTKTQKSYMKKFGILTPTTIEVPEIGQPLIPANWTDVTAMTVSYGYGVSVTPLQLLSTVNNIVGNGIPCQPTFVYKNASDRQAVIAANQQKERIVSEKTSKTIRNLMRLVVGEGTAKKADIEGYSVFGKTGTAYQAKGKSYKDKSRWTTFIGGFPLDEPQYVLLITLDDPKPTKTTHGYATAGWNAAPTAGKIIARMGPILGVQPDYEEVINPLASNMAQWVNTSHKLTN
ncbi:MAG: penicillin-binding protein 2 [Alphaproteobacteria bacterium]|nr:penicillin-binding protein 2 [Alphaproteobacteria bacterium]